MGVHIAIFSSFLPPIEGFERVLGDVMSVRDDVITMIVRYDIKIVRRTCDSVRSSLSALAGLATILS
ncbi:MAG: hypothetical protein ABSG78_24735, partial [Verrucomicrobiota bacterium]